ncbi:MAG: inositol monophosphatase [Planctomycetes bacterium]|nr:inositol monophosphatase [Planctomycetota bacterium]
MSAEASELIELERALEEIARGAGEILLSHLGRLAASEVDFKGRRDLLTRADRESEAYVLEQIGRRFPDHVVLAEESGGADRATAEAADRLWVIDPLDGTTNFVHGLPIFAVSLGVMERGRPLAGCIHAPRLDELYLASEGRGARLDGRVLRVSPREQLIEAMLATGFAYRLEELEDDNVAPFAALLRKTRAIRRCGSAALDLAWTAAGRFDAFWELHLAPWDVAAGAVIVREAGGLVSDLDGGEDWLFGRQIMAGAPRILEALRDELAAARGR